MRGFSSVVVLGAAPVAVAAAVLAGAVAFAVVAARADAAGSRSRPRLLSRSFSVGCSGESPQRPVARASSTAHFMPR